MYQIIIKPIIANINPPVLSWLVLTSFSFLSILFIFDGNMAYKIPSINKNRPNAMINSFMIKLFCFRLYISKNLKIHYQEKVLKTSLLQLVIFRMLASLYKMQKTQDLDRRHLRRFYFFLHHLLLS